MKKDENIPYSRKERKDKSFKSFIGELEGSVICDCSHGCRQWILDNAPKAVAIIKALKAGATTEELDKIAQTSSFELARAIYKDPKNWVTMKDGKAVYLDGTEVKDDE